MKVILKEEVASLGHIGDIVNVAPGYARNYLIPRSMAVEANPKNVRQFEHVKKLVAVKAEKVKAEKRSLADRLGGTTLLFARKAGEDGKLFGSITAMDIHDALLAQGIEIDRKKITIEAPIKRTGQYTVHIKLHTEIAADVKLDVVPEEAAA